MYFLEEEREKQKHSLTINCHSIANTHRTIKKWRDDVYNNITRELVWPSRDITHSYNFLNIKINYSTQPYN